MSHSATSTPPSAEMDGPTGAQRRGLDLHLAPEGVNVERVFALDHGAEMLDQGPEDFRRVPGDVGLAPAGDSRIRVDPDKA